MPARTPRAWATLRMFTSEMLRSPRRGRALLLTLGVILSLTPAAEAQQPSGYWLYVGGAWKGGFMRREECDAAAARIAAAVYECRAIMITGPPMIRGPVITSPGWTYPSRPSITPEEEQRQKHLRWDAEEELSRLVGDVAAQRIGSAVRAFAQWQLDAARRVGEALADYATNESGALVRRGELTDFAAQVERLNAAIERLERRLD